MIKSKEEWNNATKISIRITEPMTAEATRKFIEKVRQIFIDKGFPGAETKEIEVISGPLTKLTDSDSIQ